MTRNPLARLLIVLVRVYQRVPRVGPPRCKFHPSCSAYAVTALATHGLLRGTWLSARRLGRCHPWTIGGVDYVPGTADAQRYAAEQALEARRAAPAGSNDDATPDRVLLTAAARAAGEES